MFKKFYIVYAALISLFMTYANFTGWKFMDYRGLGRPGPGAIRSHYHK